NRAQQLERVNRFIEDVESRLPVRERDMVVQSKHVIVRSFVAGRAVHSILEVEGLGLAGKCLGFGSVEQLGLQDKAIRRSSDMLSSQAGLCLIMDPDEGTRETLALGDKQVVYIPLSGQDLELNLNLSSGIE